jgi:peroxiredoxin
MISDEPPASAHQCAIGGLLGTADLDLLVPEMPGGRSDAPLDLGAITIRAIRHPRALNVDDLAPPFRVETTDGKMLDLAEYRGKFVVLCFWSLHCDTCLEEVPHLKAACDAFGRNDRFAMIGVSLAPATGGIQAYAEKQGLHYGQGSVSQQSGVLDQYGIRGFPSIWLISPDGKVLARDLRGAEIKEAVATALARPR